MKNILKGLFGGRAGQKPALVPPTTSQAPLTPKSDLEALLAAASVDPEKRVEFQSALLEAGLFAATPERPETESVRDLKAGEKVALLEVPGPSGTSAVAIFTSRERIVEAFGPATGFIEMKGATLLKLVAARGAFLNPGSAHRVYWNSNELAQLLGKPTTWNVEKDTKVLLGAPAEPPKALMARIQELLEPERRINEAWFALAHWPEIGEWSWYLDVRTELAAEDVSELLAPAFQAAALEGRTLNMIVRPQSETNGAGIRLLPATGH
ncbi:MAG: enhanced serine sensitivity protein SseB C-terminal domain-containing protein [Proteobacteria bacterium]|nr:enhanced serine sensitivity protein SseB C-terminal domain-containing protein [Pseudomonadota bacterium]